MRACQYNVCIHAEPIVFVRCPIRFVCLPLCLPVCVCACASMCKYVYIWTARLRTACVCMRVWLVLYACEPFRMVLWTLVKFNTNRFFFFWIWKLRLIQNRFSFYCSPSLNSSVDQFKIWFSVRSCHRLDLYANELKKVWS